jgi:hypothetical protein
MTVTKKKKTSKRRPQVKERPATPDEIAELKRHFEANLIIRRGGRFFIKGSNLICRLDRTTDAVIAARIVNWMVVVIPEATHAVPTARRDRRTGEIVLTLSLDDAWIEFDAKG